MKAKCKTDGKTNGGRGCVPAGAVAAHFIVIGDAASILSVCVKTPGRWDKKGILSPVFRTAGGHGRYSLSDIRRFAGLPSALPRIRDGSDNNSNRGYDGNIRANL